jgi:membrane protein DedA with SNARE-associated domain
MSHFLVLAFATLVSEDAACLAAGALVSQGETGAPSAIVACAAGIYIGDLALWLAGRVFASRVLEWKAVAALLPDDGPGRFAAWFDRSARRVILASRFTPGTRLPLYLAAGACRTSFARFAGWSALAVGVWAPLLVGAAALLGTRAAAQLSDGLATNRWTMLVAILLLLGAWRLGARFASRRGRQQLAATIARVWRWEFWPMWLFYAPVGLWTALLALRYGGYRTLTAANPGIPDGGVVGESKFFILSKLPAGDTIPSALINVGEPPARAAALRACLEDCGWRFPIVMKPDVGQRGTGVRLIDTARAAEEYLERMPDRVLVQPYNPGPHEAGVFYYRLPGAARGRILAITDKHFPAVTGDGSSSIEDLVWADRRLRMQARTFVSRLGSRRHAVPARGEPVAIGIAGNHAQGTMFTDGRWMITPALEARFDAIARSYEGFYIGRFDVRYRDREAFMAGRDLAIVELNGATAECTNIYDPQGSLFSAYRQLFAQWGLVFQIGAMNRRDGVRASSTSRLVALIRRHVATATPFPVSD